MADGLRADNGAIASPPFTQGPYTWDQALTLSSTLALSDKVTGTMTSSSTSGSTSIESMYIKQTMTGAGGVGGRARFHLDTDVELGGWANALKSYVTLNDDGAATGLLSSFCAELVMPTNAPSGGNYACVEHELIMPSGTGTGTATAFQYFEVSGDDASTFDTSGYLFKLAGVSVASGKVFQENTASDATHALRVNIGGTDYFIMLTDTGA